LLSITGGCGKYRFLRKNQGLSVPAYIKRVPTCTIIDNCLSAYFYSKRVRADIKRVPTCTIVVETIVSAHTRLQ
jgi:hypothetical protein